MVYLSLFIQFSVLTCPPVPRPMNGQSSTTSALYGTQVTLTCNNGYTFEDLNQSMTIECRENAQWNNTVGDCYGKAQLIEIFIYFSNQFVHDIKRI